MNYFQSITCAYLFVIIETKKPVGKQQQEVWRVECELGVITDSDCPIDGGWTPWSPWSGCSGPCDEMGHRRRTRECNNPAPSQNGLPCTGPDHQIESCYLTNCTIEDYRKLVEGDVIRKEALRELEAVPTLMKRCLQMECAFEAIEAALQRDNTWQITPESLWNSFQCVKHNLGCPVVGEWGSWSEWTPCGARCGYGLRWRFRKCDTPPPSNAHLNCAGPPLQVDECQGDQCAINDRDSGGKWGDWGKWSPCSKNCGMGIRRRKRVCYETNTPRLLFSSWGTHCRGQHDQLEVCENKECKLNGGWSGWGPWGPCSQSCGVGKRIRIRSCTRPEPAGTGKYCSGSRNEVGPCLLAPCKTFSHTVAVFNGESFLKYAFENKRSTLFHFYARFLPLSPHGIIVRRGNAHSPLVRLSLQKWHLCLDAAGTSSACTMPRLCTRAAIDPAMWHSVLITVSSESTSMRVDNDPISIKSTFSCDPELPNVKMNIVVGERLHGEIQELILNFIPLCMVVNRNRVGKYIFCPNIGSDITYEKAGVEEAYLILDNDEYLRLPCFEDQEDWQINLSLKTKAATGTIIFLQDETAQTWLHLYLQNMRLKLKLSLADLRSESLSSSDCPPNQWLDITISKKRGVNTIEATVNAGERLHVLFEDTFTRQRYMRGNTPETKPTSRNSTYEFCTDEFFVGGVPPNIKDNIAFEDFSYLTTVIASLSINKVLLDLNEFSVERFKDNKIQVSSRTASVSGSYYETAWGKSNRLNLTCLHARSIRSPNSAHWLYLDTMVYGVLKDKSVRSMDDGRVLRLVATADNDLRGFYTCRAHSIRRTRNIVTYGVIGQINHTLTGPDLTTAIAVITTLALVLGTLACLFIEGFHDIRNGYGFYRDAHLSPEEEAEAVCKYIDQNMHLMASKSAADFAKAKARRIGRLLACQSNFSRQEPQGLMQVESLSIGESMPSEPEGLPALPEIRSSSMEPMHDAFKCELSYVSSPRHGSISSPKTKLSSSSDVTSPRVLCSRLLLGKRFNSTKDISRINKQSRVVRKSRSKLLTIKSSTFMNQSPAQKILEKFRALKSEDS